MSEKISARPPLILRSDEQAVLTEALRRFEEAEVRDGDIDAARIADRLRTMIREGGSLTGIQEIPKS